MTETKVRMEDVGSLQVAQVEDCSMLQAVPEDGATLQSQKETEAHQESHLVHVSEDQKEVKDEEEKKTGEELD